MFETFRQKIFHLWEQCDVPLLHRSKFWLTFNQPDFFNLGVRESSISYADNSEDSILFQIYLEEERRLESYFREATTRDAFEYQTHTRLINNVKNKLGFKSTIRSLITKPDDKEVEHKAIRDVVRVCCRILGRDINLFVYQGGGSNCKRTTTTI